MKNITKTNSIIRRKSYRTLLLGSTKKSVILAISLVISIYFTILPCNAHAANYYVNALIGDDSNPGTQSKPWKTLESVNSHTFEPGDIIRFNRGDIWEAQLRLNSRGTQSAPITYTAYGSGPNPIIGEVYHMPYLGNADWNIIENLSISGFREHGVNINDIAYLTIRNCYIFGCKRKGIQANKDCHYLLVEDTEIYDTTERGTWVTNSDHVTFRRVRASFCGLRSEIAEQNGINLGSGQNIVVEYCIVHDNTNGIDVGGSTDHDVTLRYNLAYQNAHSGITVANSLGKAFVYGNVVYENHLGIIVKASANAYLYNNTISKNTVYGLHLSTTGKVVVKNNIVHKNGEPDGTNILCLMPGQTLISDYNLITEHSSGETINTHKYHEPMTLAEWKLFGGEVFDQNSLNTDPVFLDEANNNFTLSTNSPCINAGYNLQSNFRNVSLPNSLWPDSVSTNDQNSYREWDIGAFIYTGPDTDGDGLPDEYETTFNLNPVLASDAPQDADGDGLTNIEEHHLGTKPSLMDTDGDSIDDFMEAAFMLNPRFEDSDQDGITDQAEFGSEAVPFDTDGDGIYDALDLDSDEDGAHDKDEANLDTDSDGLPDRLDMDTATLSTENGNISLMILDNIGRIENVIFLREPISQTGLPNLDFSYGGIQYTIKDIAEGASVRCVILMPFSLSDVTEFWKYNVTQRYYKYPAIINGNAVEFTLTDGGSGDDDQIANGTIMDPGFIGLPANSEKSNGENSGGGCSLSHQRNNNKTIFLDMLVFFLPLWFLIRFVKQDSR